jgi:hypothetical protein
LRHVLAAPLAAAVLVLPTACGGGDEPGDRDADRLSAAADVGTCVADAVAVTTYPAGFPRGYPLPQGTVVFRVEDRGAGGVIATGVTATPFEDVLHAMNAASKAGFAVTSGETEEGDAEASWTGNGFTGRWAIRRSATCPGETVVQLLSKEG